MNETTENFSELFQESIAKLDLSSGSVIKAKVIEIAPEYVIVDAGLKSEDYIATNEFKNKEGEVDVAVGDEIDVVLEMVENGRGETHLSREKAKRDESWKILETL